MKRTILLCGLTAFALASCTREIERPKPKLPPPTQSTTVSSNVFNSTEFANKKGSGPSSDATVTSSYSGSDKGNLYIGDDNVAKWDSYNGNGILWLDQIGVPTADKGINRATHGLTLADIRANISSYQFYGIYCNAITIFMPLSDLINMGGANASDPWGAGGYGNEVKLTYDLLRQRYPYQYINVVGFYPNPLTPGAYDLIALNAKLATECAGRFNFKFIDIQNLITSSSTYYTNNYWNIGAYNAIYYTVRQGTLVGGHSPNNSAALPIIEIAGVPGNWTFVGTTSASKTLNATASYDPDGTIASWSLTQLSGGTIQILNSNTSTPQLIKPTGGWPLISTFRMTATDAAGNIGVKEFSIRRTY